MEEKWKKIYSKDHKLMYMGFTVDGKPFGTGISYYENGNKCQEGVFDRKGLVYGKEYYQHGILRFEGVYTRNKGYGPNYPTYGTCYDEDGNEIFYGELKIRKMGSMGFPKVVRPESSIRERECIEVSSAKAPLSFGKDQSGDTLRCEYAEEV